MPAVAPQHKGQYGAWRGLNTPGMNKNNAPGTGLTTGQSYVRGLPTPQLPIRPLVTGMPGTNSGVPGTPTTRASGNPAVATMPTVPPPHTPYGSPRPLGVGQETTWRGGRYFANDKLIAYDRHGIMKVGNELTGRDSGFTDPPKDGPARPSLWLVQRTISYQQGTDNDLAQDDLSRPYTRNEQGMYVGEQGTGWTPISGGVPGLWIPYGSYAGYTAGPVQGIQSPVAEGAPGDGRQSVWSGPPHGLHSPTLPDYASTIGYYMAVPQQRLPRIDRPSNSTIAGQSYSQTVQPQGQTGTAVQQTLPGVGSGVSWQATKQAGWRGQRGAGNAT